jgi:hypothetical protein
MGQRAVEKTECSRRDKGPYRKQKIVDGTEGRRGDRVQWRRKRAVEEP